MATHIRKEARKETYFTHALNYLVIDMDDRGTFADVPCEDLNDTYRVDIDETNPCDVHAIDCECPDHNFRNTNCKHMRIVDLFYQNILHSYAAIAGDKTYAEAKSENAKLSDAYATIGQAMARAKLNGNRQPVTASHTASSIECRLSTIGFMK